MTYCMVIDMKRCVGCGACATMCKQENGTRPGVFRSKVMKKEIGKYPNVKRVNLPMLCMHCENPPCVDVCPTGATSKDKDGIVTVDPSECVGCRACVTACPYEARTFMEDGDGYFGKQLCPFEKVKYAEHPVGTVDKCTFCKPRLEKGLEPACVQTCVADARIFGREEDLMGMIQRRRGYTLRSELGTAPHVYYLP
ncbi:MAG: 4Fe-4S dicluster domain-containing protein [Coriobacteriales bacterium]